ncbi:MAG: DUF1080 domain-containing protein [Gemmataceae bacterium]|nr:DUF1080 domain-containing protein [Gemmataceae bacterium]
MRPALFALAAVVVSLPAGAREPKPAVGFVPLFNGKDLSGWVNVNCAPGTFFVKGDEIVTTGNPTGFLRTDRQYENFELEFEWMHVEPEKMANSGLFVWGDPLPAVGTPYTRGIEVQVLINYAPPDRWATSHGDIFSIWGAKCVPDRPHPKGIERCLPSEDRVKGAGEWNHYRVVANDGVIKLSVNGKEVSGVSKCNPRKGYLALESEGAECHFRNLKLKALPTTNPKPDEVAKVWEGHKSLFDGLDLTGWKTEKGAWKAEGGVLKAAGKADLETGAAVSRYELAFDFKLPEKAGTVAESLTVRLPGSARLVFNRKGLGLVGTATEKDPAAWLAAEGPGDGVVDLKPEQYARPGAWARAVVRSDGKEVVVRFNDHPVYRRGVAKDPPAGPVVFRPAPGLEVMNVFVRDLKGK